MSHGLEAICNLRTGKRDRPKRRNRRHDSRHAGGRHHRPTRTVVLAPMETNVPISNMGKRNMSAPAMSCDASASSSSADDVGSAQLQDLLRRMPTQYALSTSFADRMHHAKLLAEASDAAKAQQHSVRLSWDAEQRGGRAAIWLVFPDRRGSLGVITSLLSELGVNIGKASVFSSSDGLLAVDTFTVDRCVRTRSRHAPGNRSPAVQHTLAPLETIDPPSHTTLCAFARAQDGRRPRGDAARASGASPQLAVVL